MRNATPGPDSDSPGRWECSFSLSQDGARRFEKFTGANIGTRLAVVLDNQITQRRDDPERDQRSGPHQRPLVTNRKRRISPWC